jgi:hypothetical protein
MSILIGIVTVVFLYGLFCWAFPGVPKKLGIIMRGKANKYIEDYAKTPEGAAEIYTEAIMKAEEIYRRRADIYKKATGRLELEKNKLKTLEKELKVTSDRCEVLVKAGKVEEAGQLAQQRKVLIQSIEISQNNIDVFSKAEAEAKMVTEQTNAALIKLKSDSKTKVETLKSNKEAEEMFDSLDKERKDDQISKLLESVDIGLEESTQRSIGARTIYENKIETKVNKAIAVADDLETDDYIDSLKKKYNVDN